MTRYMDFKRLTATLLFCCIHVDTWLYQIQLSLGTRVGYEISRKRPDVEGSVSSLTSTCNHICLCSCSGQREHAGP